MFPRYTSVVLPSLARRQEIAVERGNSMTDVGYDGEIVLRVVTQKLATCIAYRYTYVHRS